MRPTAGDIVLAQAYVYYFNSKRQLKYVHFSFIYLFYIFVRDVVIKKNGSFLRGRRPAPTRDNAKVRRIYSKV